jgi:hypothetical protein
MIMAGSASPGTFAIEEPRARIEPAHGTTRKSVAGQGELIAEQATRAAEAAKRKHDRNRLPRRAARSGMTAGAALCGAGAAFIGLLEPCAASAADPRQVHPATLGQARCARARS